jgi:hypothetical protein
VGYFDNIARGSFRTAPTGERLFCPGGPLSRPYLIPDAETERRLYVKQVWMMRLLLGFLILGQPFLFSLVPEVTQQAPWFLGYVAAFLLAFWLVRYLVFRGDLRGLNRLPSRLPLRDYFAEMTHLGTGAITAGLLCCVAFIAIGVWMLLTGRNPAMAWLCIGFFALAAAPWGYAFWLKNRSRPAESPAVQGHAEPGVAADRPGD